MAPQLQGFLLALFFLTADVGDDVIQNVGEGFKGLASTGDGLVGADQHVSDTVAAQGMQGGHIALQAAVGLDGYEAALGTQTLALGRDDVDMIRIDFGHDHGHIRGKTMRAVVGNDRALGFGVSFFQGLDLLFLHVDSAEHEINFGGNFLHIGCIQHDELLRTFRHRHLHQPAVTDCILIRFAGAARTRSHGGQVEPGVVFQQRDKTLADHASCTDDAYIVLFHLS